MSLWRSPILYVGIILVLLVSGLVSAPVLIDWNGYRASLEDYGRKVTGRDVAIVGDVSVHLFPWPRLRLEGVRIANVEGAMQPVMMRAEAVEARMLLGSLLSGYVAVSDIRIEKPVISFERLASGEGNWWLTPEAGGASSIDGRRVSIEHLEVIGGTVFLSDSRRGGTAQLNDLDAVLSAQTVLGPWKAKGTIQYKDMPIAIGISTGRYRAGDPFKFGVRLSPVDGNGLVYSFDGDYDASAEAVVTGSIKAEPYVSEDGKGDSQSQMRPFALKAKVKLKDDSALLDGIEIAPADPQQTANLLTGSASVELGSRIAVSADLRSPKFDLDTVLGNEGRQILKSGAFLSTLTQVLDTLPDTLDGRLKLDIGNLALGGQSLEGARLEADLAPDGLIIRKMSATMPGQTTGNFTGLFLGDPDEPQLSGDVELQSASSRDFLSWLMPEWREAIGRTWTGTRGKLSLHAKLDHGRQSLRLSETSLTLDDTKATGSLAISGKDKSSASLRLAIGGLDLDRYVSGETAPAASGPSDLADRLALYADAIHSLGDIRVDVEAASVTYHGVEAKEVAADFTSKGDTIDINALDIGNVGDARVEITGSLAPKGEGRQGSGGLSVSAADPRPLFRLIGLVPEARGDEPEPAWSQAMGPLDLSLRGDLDVNPRRANAVVHLNGTAGGSLLAMEAGYEGSPSAPADGSLKVDGEISSPTAKALAALFGFPGRTEDQDPARLTVRLAGEWAKGLNATLALDALGGKASFTGSVAADAERLASADGTIALEAAQGDRLLAALGIPNPRAGSPVKVDTRANISPGRLGLSDFHGTIGDLTYDGAMTFGDGRLTVSGRAGELSLPWLVKFALLPSDGRPIDEVTLFSSEPLGGRQGSITIQSGVLHVLPGVDVRAGTTELSFGDGKLALSAAGVGPAEAPFSLTAETMRENDELKLSGTFEGGLELDRYLLAEDGGGPVLGGPISAKGAFSGHGRSPAGLALTLRGSGSVRLFGGSLAGFDGTQLAQGLRLAKSAQDVDRVVSRSFTGGAFAFEGGDAPFTLTDGEAVIGPVPVTSTDIEGAMRAVIELSTGAFDVSADLNLKGSSNLPPVEIAYAGPRDGLVRSFDAGSLKAELSARALKESMEKLEELQREQQIMFDERDQQAIEDAKRNAEIQGRRQLQDYARRLEKELTAMNAEEMKRRLRDRAAHARIAAQVKRDAAKQKQAEPLPEPATPDDTALPEMPAEKPPPVATQPPTAPAGASNGTAAPLPSSAGPLAPQDPPAPRPTADTLPEVIGPRTDALPAPDAVPAQDPGDTIDPVNAQATLPGSQELQDGLPPDPGAPSSSPIILTPPDAAGQVPVPAPISQNVPGQEPSFLDRLLRRPSGTVLPKKPLINTRNR